MSNEPGQDTVSPIPLLGFALIIPLVDDNLLEVAEIIEASDVIRRVSFRHFRAVILSRRHTYTPRAFFRVHSRECKRKSRSFLFRFGFDKESTPPGCRGRRSFFSSSIDPRPTFSFHIHQARSVSLSVFD